VGCNCGSSKKDYVYRYVSPTGSTTTYTTEVQAKAAVIKNKGGRYTKVAK
jgi:hypothetical protein